MLVLIGYTKIIKSFRRKKRETFVPVYKNIGKGQIKDKTLKIDIRRET